MPVNQNSLDLIQSLNDTAPQAVVRVVVRPTDAPGTGAGVTEAIDPKQFSSPVAYRSALIARRKQHTQPAKDEMVAKARALGLDASAAGTLNAVLVEGEAARVLRLLRQGGYESASMDSTLPG